MTGNPRLGRRSFLAAGALAFAAACSSSERAAPDTDTADTRTTDSPPTEPPATGPATFVVHGPDRDQPNRDQPNRDQVALTFHTDGDLDVADGLLDTLAARDVVMTAFVVGSWLEANPSWGPRLVDAGHEIANHTYTHPSFLSLTPTAMHDEVVRCRDVLARVTGTPGTLFRPSGTDDGTAAPPDTVLAVAGEVGYPTVLGFDVDPFDYQDPGADAIAERTLASVSPGAIVSLHFGHPDTVLALPAIIDGLDARGLRAVTASALLAR